mmetsp:Transcript_119340/g.223153  ORF Transcript_119340/g.223153 Transcript_119340/m.223153 type:complete len:121 (+) Transcript_119340:233-595(+)
MHVVGKKGSPHMAPVLYERHVLKTIHRVDGPDPHGHVLGTCCEKERVRRPGDINDIVNVSSKSSMLHKLPTGYESWCTPNLQFSAMGDGKPCAVRTPPCTVNHRLEIHSAEDSPTCKIQD